MAIKRHFIGWEQPPLLEFSRLLQEVICPDRTFDKLLIWVPSSRAARHLENELFLREVPAEAFHPPSCVTPAQYFRQIADHDGVASTSQCLYAWKQAIKKIDYRELRSIFPELDSQPGDEWAYEIAEQFIDLRARLVEENHSFASIAELNGLHDPDRWSTLKIIEAEYFAQIRSANLKDPDTCICESQPGMADAFPFKRLILTGILNLSKRQESFISLLEESGVPIDIYIPCDPANMDKFDRFGRPLSGSWICEPIGKDLLDGVIHRVATPRETIAQITKLSRSYSTDADTLVIGTPDDEIGAFCINQGILDKCEFYSPDGIPFAHTAWGKLVTGILNWKTAMDLPGLAELVNHAFFRKWMEFNEVDVLAIQTALNCLSAKHLFQNLQQLNDGNLGPIAEVGMVRHLSKNIDALLSVNRENRITEMVWHFVQNMARCNDLTDDLADSLKILEEVLQQLDDAIRSGNIPPADQVILLESQLKRIRHYPERKMEQRPVVGWLELSWETSPHLVILGLPDNKVPGAFAADSFITPMLCRKLGFYGPEEEAAFHSFRLNLILQSRKKWGKLDIILTDRDLSGDPVLPCRFLFQACESESLERINVLLAERNYSRKSYPREFGASVRIPEPGELNSMSVTGFAAYLRDPFEFLLERRLHWEAPQPFTMEMDPLMFGDLAHRVLQSLNQSDTGSALTTAEDIFAFLEKEVNDLMLQLFGGDLNVPLQIQGNSLLERLRAASGIIARERQGGWMPYRVEWAFHDETDFQIDGVCIRGKIDLLEVNSQSGEYRIIDYKTSEKSEAPERVHLQKLNSSSREPMFAETDFNVGNKSYRWKDLQLPLYQMAVEKSLGVRPGCAYLCLGKAVKDIRLQEWSPDDAHASAAQRCAFAIIRNIRDGAYPPPDRISRYDRWAVWFGDDYQQAIDRDWICKHTKGSVE